MADAEAAFPDEAGGKLEPGIALCLSGGGYRAMVFHLGALIRLNELGLLKKLARVSSVSGGSVTAGVLGLHWKDLGFAGNDVAANLKVVVEEVRKLAGQTIDVGAIGWGVLLPGSISSKVARRYDEALFHGATLQDLPDDAAGKGPRFVINATNVQTSSLWRFSRSYMGDYQVGLFEKPDLPLAVAVAASSAFPPVLSPTTLEVSQAATHPGRLDKPPYNRTVVLSDGGVYDNLGLETAFKRYETLLVSDGGQKIAPEGEPKDDWARHSLRVLDLVDNQVRSLRKRNLVGSYELARREVKPEDGARTGTYWGIRSHFADYGLTGKDDDPLGCANRNPDALAATPTRLKALPAELQEGLINWGYAICDGALRRWYLPGLKEEGFVRKEPEFPYPRGY